MGQMLKQVIRRSVALVALPILAACATDGGPGGPSVGRSGPPATVEFRTSDFAWSTAAGKNQIDGELAYKAKEVQYSCADAGVLLTPHTAWTGYRMNILYRSTEHAAEPAAEVRGRTPPGRSGDYSSFVRRASCDASGHFSFTGLPDGVWYMITVARSVPAGAGPEMAIMRRVTTRGGKVVKSRF